MKLYRLLQLDSVFSEDGLPFSFGDSFLVRHNTLFRNIRRGALANEFSFDKNPGSAYLSLPLSQLENILTSKRIPYVDNVQVLRELEERCPRGIEFFEIRENLKKNFVFHESCHAVARDVLLQGDSKCSKLSLLLEESFANTCELFGILDSEDVAHRIFYEANSYTALFEIRKNLRTVCNEIGERMVFQFFVLGYLHSNFLFESFSDKEFANISGVVSRINGTEFSTQQLKHLRSLLKVCFTLDLNFRTTTTELYLKLSGIADPGRKADFGYFDKLNSSEDYLSAIRKLADIACAKTV